MSKESERVDRLLCKWGIGIGNLGGERTKRKALSLALARSCGSQITDKVLGEFFKEAALQGVRKPSLWVKGILEDQVELQAYLPEMERLAKGRRRRGTRPEPGESLRYQVGSEADLRRRAEESGLPFKELVYQRRRATSWEQVSAGRSMGDVALALNLPEWQVEMEVDEYLREEEGTSLEEVRSEAEKRRQAAHTALMARLAPRRVSRLRIVS